MVDAIMTIGGHMKSIVSVGMDVHKNSYNLCAYDSKTGEIIREIKCASEAKNVLKLIDNIKRDYDGEVKFKAGYEAGCLGYSVHNQLEKLNIECDILAPTTMQHSSKNKVVKNDRMDARNIATNLANGTYKKVYVPCEHDKDVKEYLRMMKTAKEALKKIKQQLNAFVLREGHNYQQKSKWTEAHLQWFRGLETSDILKEVLNEYLSQYDSYTDRIERYSARVEEFSHEENYENKIAELRSIAGIDTTSTMTLHIEISDFNRFPTANAFTSYVGLVPGENSSGEKSRRTSITKQGNSIVRTTLIECAQALVKANPYIKSKRIKAKQKGQSCEVIDYADKALFRLSKKYHRMMNKGIHRNKIITAIARELACYVWGMETGNIH